MSENENKTGQSSTLIQPGQSKNQQVDDSQISDDAGSGQQEQLEVSKLFDNEGKLQDGWKKLVPEEYREDNFWNLFTDIQGILKTAGSQSKTIGKYKSEKGVLPINEKSTPEEIQAFRQALGVPADATGYKYEAPEDIASEDMSPEFMKTVLEAMNKAHFTQAHVDTALELYTNHLREIEKAELAAEDVMVQEAEDKIRSETNNYDADIHLMKMCITKFTEDWSEEDINAFFGTDTEPSGINAPEFAPLKPHFFRLFKNIGKRLQEANIIKESDSQSIAQTIQQQIKEIEERPDFRDGSLKKTDPKQYENLMKRRDLLYKKLSPK